MSGILDQTQGRIIVAGHTDDVPIHTSFYPSNWVLSSARAASVVHYLANRKIADPSRIEIRAYADTQPALPNDSEANRARNRRIEIIVSFTNELDRLLHADSEQPDEARHQGSDTDTKSDAETD
ncbi:MAG: hypothetical protein CSA54_01240 [Gammaproteobacteria bacterium]|nr:MAG: hypothetical protein CSA54_01240 [Gammaproteobacteria bacterium]